MEWHINDLSIDGQFEDHIEFRATLEPLLRLRANEPELYNRLFCSQGLSQCLASGSKKIQQVILETNDQTFKMLALSWMNKGPFWNDTREENETDLFTFQNTDVTEQGLGECARRLIAGINSNAFSFIGSSADFKDSPLTVLQGFEEEFLGRYDVVNHWKLQQISDEIQKLKPVKKIKTWEAVKIEMEDTFDDLVFSDDVMHKIASTPFSDYIRERIFILLKVLNSLVEETEEDGNLSPEGIVLHENHFVGKKAWFTDGNTQKKKNKKYKEKLSFKDPDKPEKDIFCPWHGKIKVNQIRIHFEWPRPVNQKKIKIVYIGPKLTKV